MAIENGVIILEGNIGAGKTTLAHKISDAINGIHSVLQLILLNLRLFLLLLLLKLLRLPLSLFSELQMKIA